MRAVIHRAACCAISSRYSLTISTLINDVFRSNHNFNCSSSLHRSSNYWWKLPLADSSPRMARPCRQRNCRVDNIFSSIARLAVWSADTLSLSSAATFLRFTYASHFNLDFLCELDPSCFSKRRVAFFHVQKPETLNVGSEHLENSFIFMLWTILRGWLNTRSDLSSHCTIAMASVHTSWTENSG